MIGVFAVLGDDIYFNETVQKANLQPCEIPLENWDCKKGLFIPFVAHSMSVLDILQDKEEKVFVDLPVICGIMISPDMRVHEVGVTDNEIRLRRVPTGPGVMYTRSLHRDMEESLYAAMRITKDLRRAVELAGQTTVTISGKPIYTTVQIASWAAFKRDPSLIRTLTTAKLKKIVRDTVQRVADKRLAEKA